MGSKWGGIQTHLESELLVISKHVKWQYTDTKKRQVKVPNSAGALMEKLLLFQQTSPAASLGQAPDLVTRTAQEQKINSDPPLTPLAC